MSVLRSSWRARSAGPKNDSLSKFASILSICKALLVSFLSGTHRITSFVNGLRKNQKSTHVTKLYTTARTALLSAGFHASQRKSFENRINCQNKSIQKIVDNTLNKT